MDAARYPSASGRVARYKLRAIGALVALHLSVWLELTWPWGIWFFAMTVPMVRAGEAHLIDHVRRADHPAQLRKLGHVEALHADHQNRSGDDEDREHGRSARRGQQERERGKARTRDVQEERHGPR